MRKQGSRSGLFSQCCRPIAILALLALAPVTIAEAQQVRPPDSSPPGKAPDMEIRPRGQQMPRDVKYSAWSKFCFKVPDAKMLCRTTITGTWDTGQIAVRVDLIEREGDGGARVQLYLPVGLYLQSGVKLTVDGGPPFWVPYVWCLTNACVAATLAEPELIREMEAGRSLTLEVVDSNILTVASSMSLDNFAAARNGAPARIFQQSLDNE
jgi:invasion protein IalB